MMRNIVALLLVVGFGSAVSLRKSKLHLTSASANREDPVGQVITLLEDLQSQTQDEGKEEAKTYDELACFCKETTKEKSDAIEDDKADIETHSATMEEKSSLKTQLQKQIADLNQAIADLNHEMSEEQAKRDAAKTRYEARAADMAKAVASIEGAVDVVKAASAGGSAAALLQLKEAVKSSVSLLGDRTSLKPKHLRLLQVFLEEEPEDESVPESEFDSHTSDLEFAMDGLRDMYGEKKEVVEEDEEKAVKTHNDYMVAQTDQKQQTEDELNKRTEELDECMEALGQAEKDTTEAKSKLTEEEAYLKELTATCELKAREWDQRSMMRAGELEAIAKALSIMTEKVKERDAAVNRGKEKFLQQHASSPAADAEDDEDDEGDVAFFQFPHFGSKGKLNSLLRYARERREKEKQQAPLKPLSARQERQFVKDKVITLLKTRGTSLASPVLTSMAMKVAADPFVKVKSLIEDLISKLIEEAADESTQKGWCDTEIAKAKSERDFEYAETARLNANIEGLEAARDKLAEEIDTLKTEIAELQESLAKTTKVREQEKEENMQSLQTAKEGKDAVVEAMNVLTNFYKGAAKGKVSLLQGVADDAPSSVGATANTGNQEAAGGVLGALAEIKADFQNTIKVTTDNEYQAARDFARFSTETKGAISGKETEQGIKESDHKNTVNAVTEALGDLASHQKLLDDSLKQLAALKPACIDTGDSHEDRVKKREDEIEALKSAVCILDSDGADTKC